MVQGATVNTKNITHWVERPPEQQLSHNTQKSSEDESSQYGQRPVGIRSLRELEPVGQLVVGAIAGADYLSRGIDSHQRTILVKGVEVDQKSGENGRHDDKGHHPHQWLGLKTCPLCQLESFELVRHRMAPIGAVEPRIEGEDNQILSAEWTHARSGGQNSLWIDPAHVVDRWAEFSTDAGYHYRDHQVQREEQNKNPGRHTRPGRKEIEANGANSHPDNGGLVGDRFCRF